MESALTDERIRSKTALWDLADYINTKEDVIGILEEALEENDYDFLFKVIDDISRSKGMAEIAKDLDAKGEIASQGGNPSFGVIAKVLDNIGFQISVKQKAPA